MTKPLGKWIHTGCNFEKLKKSLKEHVMWSVAPESIIQKGTINCVSDRSSVCIRQRTWVNGGAKDKMGTNIHFRRVIRIGFGHLRNIGTFRLRRSR